MRSYFIYFTIALCFIIYAMGYIKHIASIFSSTAFLNQLQNSTISTPCPCRRILPDVNQSNLLSDTINQSYLLSDTTCSQHAYARGPGQKVVAFSFFEKDNKSVVARKQTGDAENNVSGFFFKGFRINIDLLPKHYPGWIIRIYHDIEESDPLMETLC